MRLLICLDTGQIIDPSEHNILCQHLPDAWVTASRHGSQAIKLTQMELITQMELGNLDGASSFNWSKHIDMELE